MDDQTLNQSLKQTLNEHAHATIPDDYDRWSQIHEALTQEEDPMKLQALRVAPTHPRRTRRLILLIAAALLLTTTAVYAVYQVFPPPIDDPGVEGIQREGYTTELNQVQRVGDVEVQLNWGYIDSSRVVLDYQIFAINPDGTRTTDHHYALYKALLKNKDAVLEERAASIDTAGNVQPGIPGKGTLTYNYPRRFDPATMPDTMNFQLEVLVAEGKLSILRSVDYVLRSFIPLRIWRSASSDHLYERPNRLPRPESTAEPNVNASGPVQFDFALPVQRAVIIEPQQSVEANGIVGTLNMISAAPSRMEVQLCFTAPPSKSAWSPNMTVSVDEEVVRGSGGMSSPPDENGLACSEWNFDIFTTPGMTLNIKIDSISRGLDIGYLDQNQETIDNIQQIFAKHGVPLELTFDEEGKVTGYSFSAPGDSASKFNAAMLELGYLIEGPWEFTVEIPEP
jgi:hypothetical protein